MPRLTGFVRCGTCGTKTAYLNRLADGVFFVRCGRCWRWRRLGTADQGELDWVSEAAKLGESDKSVYGQVRS